MRPASLALPRRPTAADWQCRFPQARYLAGHARARAHDWPAQWRVTLRLLEAHAGRLRFFGRPSSFVHRTACDGLEYARWRRCQEAEAET